MAHNAAHGNLFDPERYTSGGEAAGIDKMDLETIARGGGFAELIQGAEQQAGVSGTTFLMSSNRDPRIPARMRTAEDRTSLPKRLTLRQAINYLHELAEKDPESLRQLQQQLVEAGLMPEEVIESGAIQWGVVDEPTRVGWESLLKLHLQNKKKPMVELLAQRKASYAPRLAEILSGQKGKPTLGTVTDAAAIRSQADEIARKTLGRKLSDDEKAIFVDLIQGLEAKNVNTEHALNTGANSLTIDDSNVEAYSQNLAQGFGLRVTSTVRDPKKNAAVGGAKHSAHLPGGPTAADFAGTKDQMDAFAAYARANSGPGKTFAKVLYGDKGHLDHVHVEYNTQITQGLKGFGQGATSNADPLDSFMRATRMQESGDRYDWNLTSKSGARGAYQFMPGTWKEAARLAGISPNDHSPAAQDAAAKALMSKYYNDFGDWRLVAIAWHAGPGRARAVANGQGLGNIGDGLISTQKYANQVLARMGGTVAAKAAPGVHLMENVDVSARLAEEVEKRNPIEAGAHSVATTFDSFLNLLGGKV